MSSDEAGMVLKLGGRDDSKMFLSYSGAQGNLKLVNSPAPIDLI